MKTFLTGLDQDLANELKKQLAIYWTYSSNAIEGNTLTLGETAFIIREGLTVAGKPLKDHIEARKHYQAIDLIYAFLDAPELTTADVCNLHTAIMAEDIIDIYSPYGKWKVEPNGTWQLNANGKSVWHEYPPPQKIPGLMENWVQVYNALPVATDASAALEHYVLLHSSFAAIHPFFDGNGRLARLLANIPVIRSGFPPLLIPPTLRMEYIQAISKLSYDADCMPEADDAYAKFTQLCRDAWSYSLELVEEAHAAQARRNSNAAPEMSM